MIYNVYKWKKKKDPIIYFLFDRDELVYVGRTKNPSNRFDGHKYSRKVFTDVYCLPVEEVYYESTEIHYIKLYQPKYNNSGKKNIDKFPTLWNGISSHIAYQLNPGVKRRYIKKHKIGYCTLWNGVSSHIINQLYGISTYHVKASVRKSYSSLWNGYVSSGRIYKDIMGFCSLWNGITTSLFNDGKMSKLRKRVIRSDGRIEFIRRTNYSTLWDGITLYHRRDHIPYCEFPFYKRLMYPMGDHKRQTRSGVWYRRRAKKYGRAIKPKFCTLWDGLHRYTQRRDVLISDLIPEKAKPATYAKRKKQLFGNSYKCHKDSNLSRERVAMGLRSQQVSIMLGWGPNKIGLVERGDKRLNWEDKIKVARFFNKPIDYLFNNEPLMLDKLWYGMNNSNWTNGYYGFYQYRKHA